MKLDKFHATVIQSSGNSWEYELPTEGSTVRGMLCYKIKTVP